VELERPEADAWLRTLQAGVKRSDVKEVVRSAATGLSYQMNMGTLELTEADSAAELLDGVGDPMLVSAFQSGYSAALAFVGRYDEALEQATAFLAFTQRYRLDFARPHALCSVARALAGLRRWTEADEHLTEAIRIARTSRDAYAQQVGVALQMRLLAQQARFQEAMAIEIPVRSPLPSARAEVVLSRALALASAGRAAEARSLCNEVRGLSHAVEPAVLAPAVEAICALRLHSPDAIERVVELEHAAFGTGAVDILVTAYRSAPELLTVLLRSSPQQERITGLIRAARDDDLARAVGQPIFTAGDPRERLTRREREVYELLVGGLTNREIAKLLFIEESTVKAHAHHIYDKLGPRSRTALAVQAILERADQATSATAPSESADESS
jgi:DNA-binding NarL/FixJ family response regulator